MHDQIGDRFTKPLCAKKLFMFQNNLNLSRLRLREGVRETVVQRSKCMPSFLNMIL
jgi:hypothetical protein